MELNHNNMEELREVAPLVVGISKETLYSLPDNYFDSLSDSILSQIRLEELRLATNPYAIPDGYFENLPQIIITKIKSTKTEVDQELSEIAPFLANIKRDNVFSLPIGYFENLSPTSRTQKRVSNVVSIKSNIRKWVTYAAAASVLFIIAISSYFFVSIHDRNAQKHLTVEQKIAELNEQEIVDYLKDNVDGFTSADLIPANDNQDPEIQNLLQNVSDQDIQNYLDDYEEAPSEKPIKGI
jgi:hypothetical protein